MSFDATGLEILSAEECRVLLGRSVLGRIVFTDQALPAVQPVNFTIADGDVVIRASKGSKLSAAARDSVVAFEVDQFDETNRTGWSVVVVGHARVVKDPDELVVLCMLPLRPWAPGRRDDFIRIRPELISGRRVPGTRDPMNSA